MSKPVYDEMTLDNLLDAIEKYSGNLSAVARAFQMSRTTIYKYVDKWKTAQDALSEARETMIDNVESSLYKQALDGNITAQIFFLKTQGKSRGYVERQEQQQVGDMNVRVSYDRSEPLPASPDPEED